MGAQQEIKVVLSLEDNVSGTFKIIEKEQEKAKDRIGETRKLLNDLFKSKYKMLVDNSDFLKSVKETQNKIIELKKLEKELKGIIKEDSKKTRIENKTKKHEGKINTKKDRVSIARKQIEFVLSGSKEKNSRLENRINKLKQEVGTFKKTYYYTLAAKDMVSDKINKVISKVKNKVVTLEVAAKDKISEKIKKVTSKSKNVLITVSARTGMAISNINKVYNAVKKPFTTSLEIKNKRSENINNAISSLKEINNKVFSPIIKIKDKSSKVISSIKSKISSLTSMLLKPLGISFNLGSIMDSAIKNGAMLEQRKISMKHYIAVNSQGKSDEQISNDSNKYTQDLRENIATTQFGNEEVFNAGSNAINLMNGNTEKAMGLVKVTEDMTALSSGKSLSDAMEALSDAKRGDLKKLNQFGITMGDSEFKGLIGKGKDDTLTSEDTMKAYEKLINEKISPVFKGGAAKQSSTSLGLIKSIKGKVDIKAQDMGLAILEKLKPVLIEIGNLIDKFSPYIDKVVASVSRGLGMIVGKLPLLKENLIQVFNGAKPAIKWMSDKGIPGAKIVIEDVMLAVSKVYKFLKPIINWTVTAAIPKVISVIGGILEKAAQVYNFIKGNWSNIRPFIEGIVIAFAAYKTILFISELKTIALTAATMALTIASAALNLIMNMNPIGLIITGIGLLIGLGILLYEHWDVVKQKAAELWENIKQTFSNVAEWFNKNVIQPVLSIVPNWLKNIFSGGANVTVSGDGNGGAKVIDGTHAKGLKNVPFDGYIAELHKGEAVIPASINPYNNSTSSSSTNSNSQVVVNINGVSKSTSEIMNELVPQLKLSLANM